MGDAENQSDECLSNIIDEICNLIEKYKGKPVMYYRLGGSKKKLIFSSGLNAGGLNDSDWPTTWPLSPGVKGRRIEVSFECPVQEETRFTDIIRY